MTNILGMIIVALACWWILSSYDKMTKTTFGEWQQTKPDPCPHCNQIDDAIGGDVRCTICKKILVKNGFGLVDKP